MHSVLQILGSVVGISVSHVFLEEDDSCKYILQSQILLKYMNRYVIQLHNVQNENLSCTCMASDGVFRYILDCMRL
jgi:hypothetical protein